MRKADLRACHLSVVLILAAFAVTTHAAEVWEGKWLEASSPNFVVTSALGKGTTTQLVQELEDFRTLAGLVTNATVLKERVPTRVFVFKGRVDEVGLSGNVAGYFQETMRANYSAVRVTDSMPLSRALQHEYTHFLIHNQSQQAYPRWYDEGLAAVLGTVDLRDGRFTLGNAAPDRMLTLAMLGAWLPYSRVVDDSQLVKMNAYDTDHFYAQSWALVHYLSFGKPDVPFSAAFRAYLADRERGTPPVPAFEKAFHEDTATLGKTIRGYLQHAHYLRGELDHPFDRSKIAVRELPSDQVAAQLADLCMAVKRIEDARKFADAALAANPDNAAAMVIHARQLAAVGRHDEAESLYQKAIALDPGSDLHHLDYGEYWITRALTSKDGEQRHEFLLRARNEFFFANKLNDHNPETLAVNGSTYLLEGIDPAKGLPTLELAHDLLPSSPEIKIMLAQLYIALGQGPKARPLLRAVVAWETGENAERAGKLLAKLDGTGADGSATTPATANPAPGGTPGPAPPPAPLSAPPPAP